MCAQLRAMYTRCFTLLRVYKSTCRYRLWYTPFLYVTCTRIYPKTESSLQWVIHMCNIEIHRGVVRHLSSKITISVSNYHKLNHTK